MSGTLVLYSGGLDSTVLLWSLKKSHHPHLKAIMFDYGQRHAKELTCGTSICVRNDIDYVLADLSAVNHLIAKGSQSGSEPVPHGHYAEESMRRTIVPNRNMIMIAIAVGHAVTTDRDKVYYAAHAGDHAVYPDCRPSFTVPLREAVVQGNAWDKVDLYSPFLDMTKADIVKLGVSIGAPLQDTWSCYAGGHAHCGKCGTCVERREAFQLAGVQDPTVYES
jgi:7-cyano-7-deazaguanine synthase